MTRTIARDVTALRARDGGRGARCRATRATTRPASVWNGDIDRRPAVIARCTTADDVAAALRYAQDAGLEIAVRGGGHSYCGARRRATAG